MNIDYRDVASASLLFQKPTANPDSFWLTGLLL